MASVRKRPWTHNGVTKEKWVVEYTDQSGKRRRLTPKSGLKRDAERERLRIEKEIEGGTHVAVDETVSVKEAARLFLDDCEGRAKLGDIAGATVFHYRNVLDDYVAPKLGNRRIAELSSDDLQAFIDGLRAKLAATTVRSVYRVLASLLWFCVRKRWVRLNILQAQRIKLPKYTKRTAVPSKADLEILLAAAEELEEDENLCTFLNRRLSVRLGMFAGLRPGEAFGLQWEDIDLGRQVLKVRHSYSLFDGLKVPKTAAGVRDVPLSKPILDAILDIANYRDAQIKIEAKSTAATTDRQTKRAWALGRSAKPILEGRSGHILVGRLGKPYNSSQTYRYWHPLMKKAGLVDADGAARFSMHALRHAAASLFIEAGLPPMNVQRVMGHASASTTFDVYGHLFPEDVRIAETAGAIAGAFGATRERQ